MRTTRRYFVCCTSRVTSTTIVFCILALVTLPISSCRARTVFCVSAVISKSPPLSAAQRTMSRAAAQRPTSWAAAQRQRSPASARRRALALAHAGFRRFFGEGLFRKNPNPKLAAALDEARDRHARRLDLPIGDPRGLERLQPVLAEGQVAATPRLARAAAALLLAVLHFLRHQHRRLLASIPCALRCVLCNRQHARAL